MGEATLAELWDDFCRQKDFEDPLLVPAKKGVYCIRIPAGMEVAFKDTIDNHPGVAYPIERLEAKRVPSSGILYIGKANGEKGLFQRLRQYMRYGFDAGNNHRGGRFSKLKDMKTLSADGVSAKTVKIKNASCWKTSRGSMAPIP